MIDRFDLWKYSHDANCWDFVSEYLKAKGVPSDVLPRFGICPSDKRGMTKASNGVIIGLAECEPRENAIACHYHGKLLTHVGVIERGMVRHAHHVSGVRRDTIKRFESMAQKTVYRIPKCLL